MRILLLDIETAPNIVHAWGLWQQNIGLNQIVKPGHILCWAAKWYDGKPMFFDSVKKSGQKKMLAGMHKLLDEADVVVTYNGKRFDIPWIQGELITCGFKPPSPFKQVDLCEVTKRTFRFPSNKLQYVSQVLKVGQKTKHEGHDLWTKCMAGDAAAWKRMETYNKQDVTLLQEVYDKMMPWIKSHPNHGIYNESSTPVCPNCGSTHLQKRGWARTLINRYQRFQCMGCGAWAKDGQTAFKKADRQSMLSSVLN